jgi:phage FluMu gp28-like protein
MSAILLPYQRRWIDDKSRMKIGMFARQTGKTFSTTLEIVEDCLEHDLRGARTRWVILSRGERQAKEAMNEGVKLHLKAFKCAFESLEAPFVLSDGTKISALEVSLTHGSRITALPANPDTARGFSANVFLDEFAFHQNSRAIWGALFPVISKPGLKLRITSTPNGKDNKFYELMSAEDSVWSRHRMDIYQAVAEGLERNVEELRAGLGDAELWAQEYELQFLDEAGSWLSYELILAAEHSSAGHPEAYEGGPCFLGNDIASRGDLWITAVFEEVGDVFWLRELVELKNATFARHDAEINRLMRSYRVLRLLMDQTGMGEKPVEDMQRLYGRKVEGVLFSGSRKLDMATVSRQMFEDRRVRIPAGNLDLRADLHKVKKVIGVSGHPRLLAERDEHGHADRFWAICLALAGAAQPRLSAAIVSGLPRESTLMLRGYDG